MVASERRGLFVTLEGGEGSGKTTLAASIARALEERGFSVCLTREPGGTEFGQQVMRLLGGDLIIPAPLAELLLFEADRAQHVSELVRPALDAAKIVVCDRFTDSSLAYQGYGRGLDLDLIRRLNGEATEGVKPDLSLLLDLPPKIGLARGGAQRDVTGRESVEFHTRVREGFLELAKAEPDRIIIIDAAQPLDDVVRAALEVIDALLPGRQ